MITKMFLRGRLRHDLGRQEKQALEDAVARQITLAPRERLASRGERLDRSYYIVSGSMLRHLGEDDGNRQIISLNILGDFVDLHGYAMKRLDHHVVALDRVVLAEFRHEAINDLVRAFPHLARAMWFSTLLDASMHREWIYRLGRLRAEGRIAHFLSELLVRLRFVEAFDGKMLSVPLLQRDYAEACGISAVHANRSFRNLRDRGLLRTHGDGRIEICDEAGLNALGQFDGSYLYGDGDLALDGLDGP